MRLPSTPYYHLAQITIECQSPLSIKGDESDPTLDNTLIRDAADNPIIPATSITGVLSHLYKETHGEDAQKKVFGFAKDKDSAISSLNINFGYVLNAEQQPQKGAIHSLSENNDSLLDYLRQLTPVIRDQVKLNEYGTAEDKAKFDRTAVPKGSRFQFEMGLAAQEPDNQTWQNLLGLLSHPKFRLGGLTHRGFGQIKVIEIKQTLLNFKDKNDLKKWQNFRQSQNWQDLQPAPETNSKTPSAHKFHTLKLKAEDFWRVGAGSTPLGEYDKIPDALPYTEDTINWEKSPTDPQRVVTIPATGIKGALRHRTLFHLRRLEQDYDGTTIQEDNPCIIQIFGTAADEQKNSQIELPNDKQPGIGGLIINDLYLEQHSTPKMMMHNKIDRFTGGVINGALFSEELLYEDTLNLEFYFDPNRLQGLDDKAQDAFIAALEDLANGRLPLGAGSSKGHGYFQAEKAELKTLIAQFQAACQ